jgi:hypothetical protein
VIHCSRDGFKGGVPHPHSDSSASGNELRQCGVSWVSLVLDSDINIPSYLSALSRVKLQIPRLRRLEAYLDVNYRNPLGPDGVLVDCFAIAPSLREVFLDQPQLGSLNTTSPSYLPTIPWVQITKISSRSRRRCSFDNFVLRIRPP